MKIAVIGYTGAGKSTLARQLGAAFDVPVLHLDAIGWTKGWKLRDAGEARAAVRAFLDGNDGWVVDGNWRKLDGSRRCAEADLVVLLDFPRWRCLLRAWRRYRANRGAWRADGAEGCPEKFDLAFLRWILRDGRAPRERACYERVVADHAGKTVVLRTPRQAAAFLEAARRRAEAETAS